MLNMPKPVTVLIAVFGLNECDRASCSARCLVGDCVWMSNLVAESDV